MFKFSKAQRPQLSDEQPTPHEPEAKVPPATPQPAQAGAPHRTLPNAQEMLEELRGQPGFGVVVTASETQPATSSKSLSKMLEAELDIAIRRERALLELMDLANRRAGDLTHEQLRRLMEAAGQA